ncbi:unnamed protein product [Urochloa decumbens]|uniref:Uncharacterized protein n=1 Tax=Urochloa decumbens TaxID=240449 RepID=A0ABC8VPE9_9POAL
MDEEELQEADVLWPWPPDTPPPSPEEEQSYLPPAAALPEYDAGAAAVEFSCEPFSGPPPASSSSSLTTSSSAQWSSSSGGFFLSGGSSSAGPAGVGPLDAAEEFLEEDVLWPDTPAGDEAAAGFCWRRVEEASSAAAAADAACGERQGWRPLVSSSPIDIPMAARGAAAARRRPSPSLSAVLARRRW